VLKEIWHALGYAWDKTYPKYARYSGAIIFAMAVRFTSLVFPALVANRTIAVNFITIVLAILAFAFVWWHAAQGALLGIAGLYGYPVGSQLFAETEEEVRKLLPARTIARIAMSFSLTVYGFALVYVLLSEWRPSSFNVGSMGVFTGLYFSLTTIATVGYGDIFPVTQIARLVVMFEILTGMLYAIFVFSVLATFVREKHRT
jgi:hypothetical protein